MPKFEAEVTIAAIQMEPIFSEPTRCAAHSSRLIEQAALGGQLIVLPELCNTGYVFPRPSNSPMHAASGT